MNEITPDIFGRFLSGEHTPSDLNAVAGYIKASKDNEEELFDMERIGDNVRSSHMGEASIAEAETRLFAKIENEERSHSRLRILKIAASFAGVLFILASVWMGFNAWQRHEAAIAMITVQAPAGHNLVLSLSDGTRVWLRKGSSMDYPKDFNGKERREVRLNGEGYFEVKKDTKWPFVVKSGNIDVTVLGTVFNMISGSEGQNAEVSLVDGMVRVHAASDGGSIVLRPGQKAEVDKATGFLQVSEVDTYADGLWHEHKTPFRNANIHEIATLIETIYNVKVVMHKGFDSDRRYNGVIDEKDSVGSMLTLLQHALPFKYSVKGNTVHLYPHY